MISVFKTEMFRLKRSKLFWIMLGVCAILPCLSALFLAALGVNDTESVGGIMELMGQEISVVSSLSSFASLMSDSSLFALICSAIVLCREFTHGTMRNVLLANKSRTQMFFAYFLTALLIGTAYYVTEFVFTLALTGAVLGFGSLTTAQATSSVFVCFALGLCSVLFVQSCVCMFLFCTRKQAGTIAFPLLICILVPGIVEMIVTYFIVAHAIVGDVVGDAALRFVPFYNATTFNASTIDTWQVIMIVFYDLLFSGVFTIAGYFTFKKADLK